MAADPQDNQQPAEQPTAPYLEAVAAYGLRGSTRFHVPGHKGGGGADQRDEIEEANNEPER